MCRIALGLAHAWHSDAQSTGYMPTQTGDLPQPVVARCVIQTLGANPSIQADYLDNESRHCESPATASARPSFIPRELS